MKRDNDCKVAVGSGDVKSVQSWIYDMQKSSWESATLQFASQEFGLTAAE